MTIRNSALIDPDRFIFSVLDSVKVQLFGGYLWQGEDISDATARGAAFNAYDRESKESVASISIVDVTDDPTEPLISALDEGQVEAVDAFLRESIESQMNVVNWMDSKLNITPDMKGLVTPYVVMIDGEGWQYVALRVAYKDRKYVTLGAFKVAKTEPLASLVFGAMKDISFTGV